MMHIRLWTQLMTSLLRSYICFSNKGFPYFHLGEVTKRLANRSSNTIPSKYENIIIYRAMLDADRNFRLHSHHILIVSNKSLSHVEVKIVWSILHNFNRCDPKCFFEKKNGIKFNQFEYN